MLKYLPNHNIKTKTKFENYRKNYHTLMRHLLTRCGRHFRLHSNQKLHKTLSKKLHIIIII